jgi:hypothetical protein
MSLVVDHIGQGAKASTFNLFMYTVTKMPVAAAVTAWYVGQWGKK